MKTAEIADLLMTAAARYETPAFIPADPVQFPHRYSEPTDIEIVGLLTALISFGSRTQIIRKADTLCHMMGPSPTRYILERRFADDFSPDNGASFYRMVSYSTVRGWMERLRAAYDGYGSLGACLSAGEGSPMERMCAFLGVTPRSPQKKINMFLRWMIRRDSPVDFGLWRQFSPADLIIPLDTHVVHTACCLGLTASETYSLTAARRITDALAQVFPGDPVRGDFALFGLGVENEI